MTSWAMASEAAAVRNDKNDGVDTGSGGSKLVKVLGVLLGICHITGLYVLMFVNCNVFSVGSLLFIAPLLPRLHHWLLAEMGAYAWRAFLFWAQVVGGLNVVYTGDTEKLIKTYKGSKLVIGNHLSFSDSFLIYSLGYAMREEAHIRAFAKRSLMYSPVVGWCWAFLNFIFLSRSFEKDKVNIQCQMKKLADRSKASYSTGNYWLTIFPEGTRSRPDKIKDSQDFSKQRGLPVFQNVLVPRTKGLLAAMGEGCEPPVLRLTADAVLDLTFGYPGRRSGGSKVRPSINDLLFGLGRRWTVHMHVRVIPMSEVPADTAGFTKWIMDLFVEKDKLLEHYNQHGSFPGETRALPAATLVDMLRNLASFALIALAVSAGGGGLIAAARAYASS